MNVLGPEGISSKKRHFEKKNVKMAILLNRDLRHKTSFLKRVTYSHGLVNR
jgi:hypothetical protein